MAVSAPSTQPAEPREEEGNGAVPPLENGDRLTRAEFERRYEAMPDVNLPGFRDGYPEDAEVHVRRAVEAHVRHFGERPRGMWPSEGSVCQQMIPLLARHGA